MSSSSTPSSNSTGTSKGDVPRVGGVRCYWALLKPQYPNPNIPGSKLELIFVHPDPVLSVHLSKQKMSMMGHGVLEFIHPAEREQARADLANAIAADDLQGSVTRMRFARLTQIRRLLGSREEELEPPYDANTFVEDSEFLILDLVLNWVADGLLLAFFHAIRDKDPVANNDPRRKSEEWTNYCGTAYMGEDQIDALRVNVSSFLPAPQPSHFPPARVFQLHTTIDSPTMPNQLIFTWPPARPPHSTSTYDGLYDAEEYSNLMRGVDMDPNLLSGHQGELKTNCTTRFGAKHSVTTEGVYRHINSVLVPYGSLIFSCYQTTKQVELHMASPRESTSYSGEVTSTSVPHNSSTSTGMDYGHGGYDTINHHHHQDHHQEWNQPDVSHFNQDWHNPDTHTAPTMDHYQQPQYSMRYSPTAPDYSNFPNHHHHTHHSPSPFLEAGGSSSFGSVFSQDNSLYPTPGSQDTVKSSGRRKSPSEGGSGRVSASSRPLVKPPGDVKCCRMCGILESPEWRRSENGVKDLCNACGLKLGRQIAKREGRQKPRKKKSSISALPLG